MSAPSSRPLTRCMPQGSRRRPLDPAVGVCQECQQGDRPSGRPGVSAEDECPERLPVGDAPHSTERIDAAEIVEDEWAGEPGPVGDYGGGDREQPAQRDPRSRHKRPNQQRRLLHSWGHPDSRMPGILSAGVLLRPATVSRFQDRSSSSSQGSAISRKGPGSPRPPSSRKAAPASGNSVK